MNEDITRYMNDDITEGFRLTKTPHVHDENYPSSSLFQKARQSNLPNQREEVKVGTGELLSATRRNVFSKKKSFSFSTESPSPSYFANATVNPAVKAQLFPCKRNSITTTGLNETETETESEADAQRRLYLEEPGHEGEVSCTGYYSKLSDIMQSPASSPALDA